MCKLEIGKEQFRNLTLDGKLEVLYDNTCNLDSKVEKRARNTAITTTVVILLPIILTLIGLMVR